MPGPNPSRQITIEESHTSRRLERVRAIQKAHERFLKAHSDLDLATREVDEQIQRLGVKKDWYVKCQLLLATREVELNAKLSYVRLD